MSTGSFFFSIIAHLFAFAVLYTFVSARLETPQQNPRVVFQLEGRPNTQPNHPTQRQKIQSNARENSTRPSYRSSNLLAHPAKGTTLTPNGAPLILTQNSDILKEILQKIDSSLEYPASLRRRRIYGQSLIRIVVDENGKIELSEITQSSGYAELDQLVIDAIARVGSFATIWKKNTGRMDLKLPIQFKLNGS